MPRTGFTRATEPDPEPWKVAYSVPEAAAALGVGTTTIYQAVRSGALDHRWLGAKLLIPRVALVAWLDALPQEQE
jgi:excisionase family DNA binding protein